MGSRSRARKIALGMALAAAAPASTACVKSTLPYDWGRALAHPTMTADDTSSAMDGRIREVSEGAAGGLGSAR